MLSEDMDGGGDVCFAFAVVATHSVGAIRTMRSGSGRRDRPMFVPVCSGQQQRCWLTRKCQVLELACVALGCSTWEKEPRQLVFSHS